MPNPRHQPRFDCLQPDSFGRSDVKWKTDADAIVRSRIAASRTQHEIVVALREEMGRRLNRSAWDERDAARYSAPFSRVGLYSIIARTPYGRAKELWAGRVAMRLEEVYYAQAVLGTGGRWVWLERASKLGTKGPGGTGAESRVRRRLRDD